MISLKKVTILVNNKTILKDFNYEFDENKVYALMGPNGSGKSTLAYTIAGHPSYVVKNGEIKFRHRSINNLTADKRAKKGIFLSFQSPLSLNGISVFQLLRLALSGKEEPLAIKRKIDRIAKQLKIKRELLSRPLNEGASGGEKKKLELLQAAVLNPKFLIFDEIDTGVDIDALKTISKFLDRFKNKRTMILITHYNRILKYIKPDKVLVIKNGQLVKEGDFTLPQRIEKNGYEKI